MLNQSSIAKIKKYVGWENKPDGAIEALAELVTDCVVDSCYEQAVRRPGSPGICTWQVLTRLGHYPRFPTVQAPKKAMRCE